MHPSVAFKHCMGMGCLIWDDDYEEYWLGPGIGSTEYKSDAHRYIVGDGITTEIADDPAIRFFVL